MSLTYMCGFNVSFVIFYGFSIIGVSIRAWSGLVWFGLPVQIDLVYTRSCTHRTFNWILELFISILIHTVWLRSPLKVGCHTA